MSLSQALGSAVAGLRVTQSALSLVGANVANAQTPGYVRKTLDQAETAAAGAGISVGTNGIDRELDQYLQRQLRAESSGGAYADLRSQFYQRLQDVYGDPGSSSSLETTYSNFTTALQALSTSPEDTSARSGVLNAAQVLSQQLNGLTASVQGLRSDAEQGLADSITAANDALQQIADINQKLATSTANDTATAALLDQRDQYLDKLSQLMDIRVVLGDFNQINVFTTSGTQLVGLQAAHLAFDPHGSITPQAQWSDDPTKRGVGTITLTTINGSPIDLIANNSIRSGQIAAYLEMRDQVLVQTQSQLDQIAASMSQALSDQTTAGSAASAPPQAGFDIDVGGLSAGNSFQVTYTDTATTTQHKLTIVRVDDPTALPLPSSSDPNNQVIGVDWSGGLASVVSQLNNKLNGKPQFSILAGTTLRVLDDGAANAININSVSATSTVTALASGVPQLPFFLDANTPYTGAITGAGSEVTGFAGRITVNAALVADPSKLVVFNTSPLTPSGDSTRPSFLYDQLTSVSLAFSPAAGIGTAAAPFSGTLPDYLRQVLSQQGSAADSAKNLADGQDLVVNALKQRFSDSASVNIDQEMSNLLILQNTYGANARVISAVKDMFTALMNI